MAVFAPLKSLKLISRKIERQEISEMFTVTESTVWKLHVNSFLLIFDKYFVKAMFLLKKLISRNIFSVRVKFCFFLTVEISATQILREIKYVILKP